MIFLHIKCLAPATHYLGTRLFRFPVAQQPKLGLGHIVLRFLDHTPFDTQLAGLLGANYQIGAEHATNTKKKNHALSGIRIPDPSNQAAAELCLRPHGHRDQQVKLYAEEKFPMVNILSFLIL